MALPHDLDAPSHLHAEILFLRFRQRVAEFAGRRRLGGGHVARRILHFLLDLCELLDELLLFSLQGLRLAPRGSGLLQQAWPALTALLVLHHTTERLAHFLLEVFLFFRKLLRFAREFFHLLASLLPALARQHFARFAQPFGCAPGFGLTLGCSLILRGSGVLHVARRFREPLV